MGRVVALLLSALLLLASGCTDPNDGSGGFAPPVGQRWAGFNGFVVAVPETWTSVLQQPCQPPVPEVVTFQVPGSFTQLGCGMDVPDTADPRPSLYVGSSNNWERDLKKTWRPMPVGDDVGYLSQYFGDPAHPKSFGLYSRGFEIPGKVLFEVSAPTKRQVLAILRSVRQLLADLTLVPRETTVDGTPVDMVQRVRSAGFHVRTAEEPAPAWMLDPSPGQFIRTDPAVGTPLEPGSTVTVYVARNH